MPWESIKEHLRVLLPENTMSLWIAPLECRHDSEELVELIAPDRFFCSWVKENFLSLINESLSQLDFPETRIKLSVATEKPQYLLPPSREESQLRLPSCPKVRPTIRTLHPRYTFEEFMVGESNVMARTACEAMANNSDALGNCLFIDSGPGLGKSHLTHAVAHKILQEEPSTRLHYLTAQQLTAEMVKCIRSNTMDKFKEKYQNQCDVLLMEDIHTLSGRTKTQEELAAALDILMKQDKRIIFTSKIPSRDIPDLEPEVRSRLAGGLITTINPPDLRTRTHIIKKKAENNALNLDEEMVMYLAQAIKGDIRQVESSIIGLKAKMGLMGCQPNLELIKEVVSNIIGCPSSSISAEIIRDFVAQQFKTSAEELQSKSRKRTVAFPRQVAMYLSRKLTGQALADIGGAFNRDHSTVVHSVRVISDSINRSTSVRGQIDLLTEKLRKKYL